MGQLDKRLAALEQATNRVQPQQTVIRWRSDDGVELVQVCWGGTPHSKPILASLWDAWDEKGDDHAPN